MQDASGSGRKTSGRFSYYRWMKTDGWPEKDMRMYGLTSDIVERYDEEKALYIKYKKMLIVK